MVNAAGLEQRPLADDRLGDLGILQLAGGQVTGAGINGKLFVVEGEGRIWLFGEGQIGLKESTDGADVFPIIVEEKTLEIITALQGGGNNFLAEIGGAWIGVQQIKQGIAAEHIDAH